MIMGANGFVGRTLTTAILTSALLRQTDGVLVPAEELVLVDRENAEPVDLAALGKSELTQVREVRGDLADAAFVNRLAALRCDAIFHLAASMTLDAERDPSAAYAVNVESIRQLVERADNVPRIIFASSIAVFGGLLPDTVGDSLRPEPDTTYGTHKAMAELLLADCSRTGRVDGRVLRLPVVLVRRNGAATPTVSDQIAAIVREPLAGQDIDIGLRTDTRVAVASAPAVARALIALHNIPAVDLPHGRVVIFPSLTVRVSEMLAALEPYRADRKIGNVRFVPDARLQRVVESWPSHFATETASKLGLHADVSFKQIIADYVAGMAPH
jgi:nucleoside-diphosphate-sugar epimerase